MRKLSLSYLEQQAANEKLLLRLQVRRPLGLWALRLVVAKSIDAKSVRLLGEMKAWAYGRKHGLQLDTMHIDPKANAGVGHLIWAATMAWALEVTPCRKTRLLAIRDDDHQHSVLVRYFRQRGFSVVREVGADPLDLPLRIVWGGAGALMVADCQEVLLRNWQRWGVYRETYGLDHSS